MSNVVWAALVALLLYLALRVVQMKRRSIPFLLAYPLFVLIFFGGGIGVFLGASHAAAMRGYTSEDPIVLALVMVATGASLLPLWWIARRVIR